MAVPRVGVLSVLRVVGVSVLFVLSGALGPVTRARAAEAPASDVQPALQNDQGAASNVDQSAPPSGFQLNAPVQGEAQQTQPAVNVELPGSSAGQTGVAIPQLPVESFPAGQPENEQSPTTPTLTTGQPAAEETTAGGGASAESSGAEGGRHESIPPVSTEKSRGEEPGTEGAPESGTEPPPEWLYDEFAGETTPPPEPAPAAQETKEPERVMAPSPPPRIHLPTRRPASRPRAPLPSSRKVEEVARKSASPALFTVGFVLLAVALGLHLRQRGPSVEALTQTADIESLLALLQSEQPILRERSRQALVERLSAPPADDKVSELLRALYSGDSEIQQLAGQALRQLQTPAGTRALASAVRDYPGRLSENMRIELLEELATRPEVEAVDALLDALHDRSATLRELAYGRLYALIDSLREQGAVAALARVMDRGDADLSRGAMAALAQTGSEQAVAPLARFAGDYALPPEARVAAVQALQSLGGTEARDALEERGHDFYPQVREAAATATGREPTPEGATLDAVREQVAEELYTALAAHFEGRRLTGDDGEAVRWEDVARTAAARLEDAGGRDLLHAVFHQVDRRLRETHGRSPRMLRRWWQQQGHW